MLVLVLLLVVLVFADLFKAVRVHLLAALVLSIAHVLLLFVRALLLRLQYVGYRYCSAMPKESQHTATATHPNTQPTQPFGMTPQVGAANATGAREECKANESFRVSSIMQPVPSREE